MKFTFRQFLKNRGFGAVFILALIMLTVGCNKSTHVTTSAGGHRIDADIQGNHSIETQPSQAVLSSEFGKVTVQASRVQLDDLQWTAIPEGAPVLVSISKRKLRVTAGRVTVARSVR